MIVTNNPFISQHTEQPLQTKALAELATAVALAALCVPFVAAGGSIALLFAGAAAPVALNLFLRWASSSPFVETICATNFAAFGTFNAQALVHETGHAAAIASIFRNAGPEIRLIPYAHGETVFFVSGLTPFGNRIGHRGAILLTSAAGPALALLIAHIILIAGLILKNKYLVATSLVCSAAHSYYALSACWHSPAYLDHDFVRLRAFGLHPLAAAVGILAIPLLIASAAWIAGKMSRMAG